MNIPTYCNLSLDLLIHISRYLSSPQDIRNMQTCNKVVISNMGLFKPVRLSSVLKHKISCKSVLHLIVDINKPLLFIYNCILDKTFKHEFLMGFTKIITLQFDNNFNQIFGSFEYLLFGNAKHMIFGDSFNQSFFSKSELNELKSLDIHKFSKTFNVLNNMKSLEWLIFGRSFNQHIMKYSKSISRWRHNNIIYIFNDDSCLPQSITCLKFGRNFNRHITDLKLPNLTRLSFGNNFCQSCDIDKSNLIHFFCIPNVKLEVSVSYRDFSHRDLSYQNISSLFFNGRHTSISYIFKTNYT